MDKRLTPEDVEWQLEEMWDAVESNRNEEDYHTAHQQAQEVEERLRARLKAQDRLDKAAPELLEECKKAAVLLRLLTIRQIIEGGDEAIEAAGLNPWCMNEGLATGDERFIAWSIQAAIHKAEHDVEEEW